MTDKNVLPDEATVSYQSGKNETTYAVDCFLHPSDCDKLMDVIFDFVKNKTSKSREFSVRFNNDLEEIKNERIKMNATLLKHPSGRHG